MSLSEELKWRGFVNQTTLADLSALDKRPWTFYHGYDAASADSLTIGNLAALMLDKCFIRHGHKAILLVGGATSLIGDPGGKTSERALQSNDEVAGNIERISLQIKKILGKSTRVVNNVGWLSKIDVLTFLRDTGKHFSMTPLVQRDYIAKRMGEGGSGISYAEFSYTLLQGYDFLHLYKEFGVELQLAGSDQWGNSLSGVELVRKVVGKEVHVLTIPLIIDKATGVKFGKSEEGAVWLDEDKTSAYQFYQFWLNTDDKGAESYLKVFTELDKDAIAKVMEGFQKNKANRLAQKTLAYEVTKLVYGAEKAEEQKLIAEVLFGNENSLDLSDGSFESLIKELPVATLSKNMHQEDLVGALVRTGLASSKTQARRFMAQGAIYVNNRQIPSDFHFDTGAKYAVVRRGKNKNAVIKIAS